jgi:CRP-like cAMP-binding protein
LKTFSLSEQKEFLDKDRKKYKLFPDKTEDEILEMFYKKRLNHSNINFLKIKRMFNLFPNISDEDVLPMIGESKIKTYRNNQIIYNEKDKTQDVFYVLTGNVVVQKDDVELMSVGKNQFFGEMALITNEPRHGTAKVVGKVANVMVFSFSPMAKKTKAYSRFIEHIAIEVSQKLKKAHAELLKLKTCKV